MDDSFDKLWEKYVPASGQADTVQGELLRAESKLRDEARRNGNANWNTDFDILADFIESTLNGDSIFSQNEKNLVSEYISKIKSESTNPTFNNNRFEFLSDLIVLFCAAHKEPISRKPNLDLHR